MSFEPPFDEWDADEDYEAPEPPRWRRPLLMGVAAITALALAAVPVYNVFIARQVADNGLAVCGFDYCIVQEAVTDAGLDGVMARLANTFLDDEEAQQWADDLTFEIGIEPVAVRVVDDLEGSPAGVYDPELRTATVERPARAWTVLHEVAHAVALGHGEAFTDEVIAMSRLVDAGILTPP